MEFTQRLIMTPGPTTISEHVRRAAAKPIMNPDIDPDFFLFYDNLCSKMQKIYDTKNHMIIMAGDGMLALESAVVSLIQPEDVVLCLDNGVFGNGFIDLVRMYGATPVILSKDSKTPFTPEEVEACLLANPEISVATLVHCETPTGLLNPLDQIGPLLAQHGVVSIVDAVSSLAGELVLTDTWKLDVVLGASQKCLSSTPGLSTISVSKRAWDKILGRKNPIPGYYLNLGVWKSMWFEKREFPYTQSVSDLYALDAAVDVALQESNGLYLRHKKIGNCVRQTLKETGFVIYPNEGAASNTVTAFFKPEELPDDAFRAHMWNHYDVLMAGTFGPMGGKLWRIGHMGENAREDKVFLFFRAFENTLKDFSILPTPELASTFARVIRTWHT